MPETWDCPRCGLPAGQRQGQPARGAEDRAVQDPPGLREGAAQRRRRRGHPQRGAREAPRQVGPRDSRGPLPHRGGGPRRVPDMVCSGAGERRRSGGSAAAAASSSSAMVRSRPRAPAPGTCTGPASDSARRTASALSASGHEQPDLARGRQGREGQRDPLRRGLGGAVHAHDRADRLVDARHLREQARDVGVGSEPEQAHVERRQVRVVLAARRRLELAGVDGRCGVDVESGVGRRHPVHLRRVERHVVEQRLARLDVVAVRVAGRARSARRPTTRAGRPSRSSRATARRSARRGRRCRSVPPVRQTWACRPSAWASTSAVDEPRCDAVGELLRRRAARAPRACSRGPPALCRSLARPSLRRGRSLARRSLAHRSLRGWCLRGHRLCPTAPRASPWTGRSATTRRRGRGGPRGSRRRPRRGRGGAAPRR